MYKDAATLMLYSNASRPLVCSSFQLTHVSVNTKQQQKQNYIEKNEAHVKSSVKEAARRCQTTRSIITTLRAWPSNFQSREPTRSSAESLPPPPPPSPPPTPNTVWFIITVRIHFTNLELRRRENPGENTAYQSREPATSQPSRQIRHESVYIPSGVSTHHCSRRNTETFKSRTIFIFVIFPGHVMSHFYLLAGVSKGIEGTNVNVVLAPPVVPSGVWRLGGHSLPAFSFFFFFCPLTTWLISLADLT